MRNGHGDALEHAGRGDELPALYETEARKTHSDDRPVRLLIERGRAVPGNGRLADPPDRPEEGGAARRRRPHLAAVGARIPAVAAEAIGPGARGDPRPYYDVLIDLAIADHRPEDVLRWYDRWRAARKASPDAFTWSAPHISADRVAEAVTASHPQRALEIYRQALDHHLPQASTTSYEAVASYLRKMRPILPSLDRESDWVQTVQEIRERYRNRPRFLEILDRLEDRPIASARTGRR